MRSPLRLLCPSDPDPKIWELAIKSSPAPIPLPTDNSAECFLGRREAKSAKRISDEIGENEPDSAFAF